VAYGRVAAYCDSARGSANPEHWSKRLQTAIKDELFAFLAGYTVGGIDLPALLSSTWDAEEIVRRLNAEFEMDYSTMLSHAVGIDFFRDAYKAHYDHWEKDSDKELESLTGTVSAYFGSSPATPRGNAKLSQRGRRARHVYAAATGFFIATCVAFVCAVGITVMMASSLPSQKTEPPANPIQINPQARPSGVTPNEPR
jgi:hypothetical protein